MSDYIFPFYQIPFLNDALTDQILPFDQYCNLYATPLGSNDEPFNDIDDFDNDILDLNASDCEYIDLSDFRNQSSSNLSVFHLNINSVPKKLEELVSSILSKNPPSIIALSETKLNQQIENLYSIDGYNAIFNSNSTSSGGIALFLKSNIKFSLIEELTYSTSFLESLSVRIDVNGKILNVCCIYRRPGGNIDDFMNAYSFILNNLSREKSLIIGDTNLDLLRVSNSRVVENFVNCNFEQSFFSLINRPTRVTSHSATVIDQAFCNFISDSSINSLIILCHLSDHFAVHIELTDTPDHGEDTATLVRDWRALDNGKLAEAVQEGLRHIPDNATRTIDDALQDLIKCIRSAMDSTCPLVPRRSNSRRKNKPWISQDIVAQINAKNKLYDKFCKRPLTYGDQFRSARNHVTNLIRQSRASYYQNLLKSHMSNSKKTWEVLNTLLNRSRKSNDLFTFISDGVNTANDPKGIAETFNKYFVNAPLTISDSLPSSSTSFREYLTGEYGEFSAFDNITTDDIHKIVTKMKNSGGGGSLEIPNRVVKSIIHVIDKRLADLFNSCFREGYFPIAFKTAQVIPLHKSGDPEKAQNYRPISILTCLSKILEKLIFVQISQYCESFKIINPNQWGFRKGVSTDMSIGKFLQKVITTLNNKEFGLAIFLDLQKAFDLVSHPILISKLRHYGINGAPLNLISSFLTNRQQCVKTNNTISSIKAVSIGTPQGSVLSPLLFNIFINDFVNCSNILHFNQYADDTSLFLSDKNAQNLYIRMNEELKKVARWIEANSLSLNVTKTVYLLFSGKKKCKKFNFTPY